MVVNPSGSITVTNDGGTVILEEAFQAVMVSTFETPTNPSYISRLGFKSNRQYVYCE